MKQIEIINIQRNPSYIEVNYLMRFPMPASLLLNGTPYAKVDKILQGYGYQYENDNGVHSVIFIDTVSISGSPTLNQFKNQIVNKYGSKAADVSSIILKPFDVLLSGYYDGTNWIIE